MNPEASTFLGGKVIKQSLPTVPPGSGSTVPGPKRLLLPQGELASFYDEDEPMRYLAFIELRAGTNRGNHCHHAKREYIYLIAGAVLIVAEDMETHERVSFELKAGDRAFIDIGVAHVLKVLQSGQAIEFSPQRFNSADTYRFELL